MKTMYALEQSFHRRWEILGAVLLVCSGSAGAVSIDVGNPEITFSWNNTIRYNAGWRLRQIDPVIANNRNTDEGTLSYERGQMVTNRLDLLSELDFDYRREMGARLSAAAWRDFAFKDHVNFNPNIAGNIPSYTNGEISDRTNRYQRGPNGEILDAYVYKNFQLGGGRFGLKVGRQTTLWGEAAILQPFGISDEQAPIDTIKSVTNPGVDAKEIAIPIGQVSMAWQATPQLSVLGQYFLEHRNSRLPQGGTYWGATDFLLDGPDRFPLPGGAFLTNRGFVKPSNGGDWGLGLRWNPNWLDGGTGGLYYREITEKSAALSASPRTLSYSYFFPKDQRALGASLTYNLGGISIGADIVRRTNTVLNSNVGDGSFNVARGNAWTALVNAVYLFGPNAVWSQASLLTELGYSRLSRVTSGEQYFVGCYKRPAGDQDAKTGCSTRDNFQTAVRFTPSWTAVRPGWDASVSTALTYGLKGNSSLTLPSHGQEGVGSYSVGTTWTYNARHDFSLTYIGYLATYEQGSNGLMRVSNGSQRQDRGWLSFTYKGSF